jgi:hypothetical protein
MELTERMIQQLESKLTATLEEYERRKMYFIVDVKTQIDSDTFEQNAISSLLYMQKLKTQIMEYNRILETMKLAVELGGEE